MSSEVLQAKRYPYLGTASWHDYEKYKAIKEEKRLLNARIKELDEATHHLNKLLETQFEEGREFRRLRGGILLKRIVHTIPDKIVTPEMVGKIVTKGYSYTEYKEIEG